MIYLRTGKPGASKSLNSIVELVQTHDSERPYFYTNVKLLMLDYDVASSFSGWFYGWYWLRLKDKKARNAILKVMRRVHDNDEFLSLSDLPWLEPFFNKHDHFETWLYWVRKVYSPKQRKLFEEYIQNTQGTEYCSFEYVKKFNFHFTRFDDAKKWFELPKRSVIWIDECQQFFPPRGVGAKVPEWIGKFETHRHDGYDVHLVTQDPKLMDVNIRRLTGRHVHYHNSFGGERVTRYQASKAIDPDNWHDTNQCEKKLIRRDKAFYGIYWSAEIHTHKFKMPKFVFIGGALVVLVVCMFAWFYLTLFGDDTQPATVAAPETETVIRQLESTPTTQDEFLKSNLATLTLDVYIDGVTVEHRGELKRYFYSFSNSKTKAQFRPERIGLEVLPMSECLAMLRYDGVETMVMCNPFDEIAQPEPQQSEKPQIPQSGDVQVAGLF